MRDVIRESTCTLYMEGKHSKCGQVSMEFSIADTSV